MSSSMSTSADDRILSLIHNLLLEEQSNNSRGQADDSNLLAGLDFAGSSTGGGGITGAVDDGVSSSISSIHNQAVTSRNGSSHGGRGNGHPHLKTQNEMHHLPPQIGQPGGRIHSHYDDILRSDSSCAGVSGLHMESLYNWKALSSPASHLQHLSLNPLQLGSSKESPHFAATTSLAPYTTSGSSIDSLPQAIVGRQLSGGGANNAACSSSTSTVPSSLGQQAPGSGLRSVPDLLKQHSLQQPTMSPMSAFDSQPADLSHLIGSLVFPNCGGHNTFDVGSSSSSTSTLVTSTSLNSYDLPISRMSPFQPIGSGGRDNGGIMSHQNHHETMSHFSLAGEPLLSTSSALRDTGTNAIMNHAQHRQQQQRMNSARSAFQLEKFESQIRIIANEIQSTIQQHMNGLQTRKEQLLEQLETIRNIYVEIFRSRTNMLGGGGGGVGSNLTLQDTMAAEEHVELPLPSISFTKPDPALQKAVGSLGFLTAPAFAPYCTASGEGLEFAVPGLNASFIIISKNCFNDELLLGRENISVSVVVLSNNNHAADQTGTSRSTSTADGTSTGTSTSFSATATTSGYGASLAASFRDGRSCSPYGVPTSTSVSTSASSTTGFNLATPTSSLSINGSHSSLNTKIVVNHSLLDHNNGKYTVTYGVPVMRNPPERVIISVSINGMPITGSPFRVPVKLQQRQTWKKALTYGGEGNSIGQFCRPWGVAIGRMPCDMSARRDSDSATGSSVKSDQHSSALGGPLNSGSSSASSTTQLPNNANETTGNATTIPTSSTNEYLIAVADRSNNRVQLFKYDMACNQLNIVNVFGSGPGTRQGQFDRPAGICFNTSLGHIIVADKDNHRVQVFDLTGRYLFKFGEKGNRAGQFCYPWDLDSCPDSTHQILVSDTRNRRVQLFTPYGQYMMHFAQPLDSPRGVGFLGAKRLVVSDFNKHRLLIFDKNARDDHSSSSSTSSASSSPPNSSLTRSIGFGEGSGWGEFLRPQGLSISGKYVYCSDSRNNRICCYNLDTQVFEYLSDELALDRPSGIAVLDNLLVVVDFGNNRIQICHR